MTAPSDPPVVARQPPIPVDVLRGPLVESRHVVYGCLWGGGGEGETRGGSLRATWGDADLVSYLRSALKPVQVLPLLIDGVADDLGWTEEEIALACGSHSAQDVHLAVLKDMMEKSGVDAGSLRCGRHRPFHKDSARRVGEDYSMVHNNCSGKHVAMLAWCEAQGADPTTYLSPDHPLQRRILHYTSLLTDLPQIDMGIGVDGCGVPTMAVPLAAMARLFYLLGRPAELLETRAVESLPEDEAERFVTAVERTRTAMQRHPFLVAGDERADTDVISYTDGRLVTKAGAEGVWCGVDTHSGTAFAFKTIDGHFRATVPATLEVLASRRLLLEPEVVALERHHRPVLKNHAGSAVGKIVPRL